MKSNVLNFINKCEGWKTAIKQLHWTAKNMSEHKLFDDIASSVSEIQDEVAEEEQGLHGRIKKNELKPIPYKIGYSKEFLDDMLKDTKSFYKTVKGEEYIGIRSFLENFIGEISKYKYLLDLCLKEDIIRRFKLSLNEAKDYSMDAERRREQSRENSRMKREWRKNRTSNSDEQEKKVPKKRKSDDKPEFSDKQSDLYDMSRKQSEIERRDNVRKENNPKLSKQQKHRLKVILAKTVELKNTFEYQLKHIDLSDEMYQELEEELKKITKVISDVSKKLGKEISDKVKTNSEK